MVIKGNDLKKSLAFYRNGLGLPAQFSAELEDGADCTAFELAGDLWLVLMPRAEFAKCTKIAYQPDAPRGPSECIRFCVPPEPVFGASSFPIKLRTWRSPHHRKTKMHPTV
jgi:hypothetical protein